MSSMISYVISEKALTVINDDGSDLTMHRDHRNWDDAIEAIRQEDNDRLAILMQPKIAINKFTDGNFKVEGDVITYNDKALDNTFAAKKILKFVNDDLPYKPLIRFFEKLTLNPSYSVRHRLMEFLDKSDLPITTDGDFLAYKYTRADGYDAHSGKVKYPLHEFVTMPRNEVDDDPENTCSRGLHVASKDYFEGSFFNNYRFITCKIHPRDVVAIPKDYRSTKMRVCALYVQAELDKKPEADNIWREDVVDEETEEYSEEYSEEY